jgi:hypothetical protein
MGTAALGRRTRAGVALACALGALLALTGAAAGGTVTAGGPTSSQGDHGLPFSFD